MCVFGIWIQKTKLVVPLSKNIKQEHQKRYNFNHGTCFETGKTPKAH